MPGILDRLSQLTPAQVPSDEGFPSDDRTVRDLIGNFISGREQAYWRDVVLPLLRGGAPPDQPIVDQLSGQPGFPEPTMASLLAQSVLPEQRNPDVQRQTEMFGETNRPIPQSVEGFLGDKQTLIDQSNFFTQGRNPLEEVIPQTDPREKSTIDILAERFAGPNESENVRNSVIETLMSMFAGGGVQVAKGVAKKGLVNSVLNAMDPRVPSGQLNAMLGIERFQPLFHGTSSAENVDDILRQGFTQGQSAELNIPGVSLSRDPTVSTGGFAQGNAANVLRVTPDFDPSEVRNLRPSEFVTGVSDGAVVVTLEACLRDGDRQVVRVCVLR